MFLKDNLISAKENRTSNNTAINRENNEKKVSNTHLKLRIILTDNFPFTIHSHSFPKHKKVTYSLDLLKGAI